MMGEDSLILFKGGSGSIATTTGGSGSSGGSGRR